MSDIPDIEETRRDPIVAEVRAAREGILSEAGHDLHRLCEILRSDQETSEQEVVQRQPRRISRPA